MYSTSNIKTSFLIIRRYLYTLYNCFFQCDWVKMYRVRACFHATIHSFWFDFRKKKNTLKKLHSRKILHTVVVNDIIMVELILQKWVTLNLKHKNNHAFKYKHFFKNILTKGKQKCILMHVLWAIIIRYNFCTTTLPLIQEHNESCGKPYYSGCNSH